MSIVHSYAVGNGDMFSIRHNSDNCTIIDCNISDKDKDWLLKEIDKQRKGKQITRFISTHPDNDHLTGLVTLDDHINILNFYVVKNNAIKEKEDDDFKRYKKLRDGDKAFYLFKGCKRRWMNQKSKERGPAGIDIHWPITSNKYFKEALDDASDGKSPNNISPVIAYSLNSGVDMAWFGDLEADFMEKIKDEISWPDVDILFAPHHGRDSGKIPKSILEEMDPQDCSDWRGPIQESELLSRLQHDYSEFRRFHIFRVSEKVGAHLCGEFDLQCGLPRGQGSRYVLQLHRLLGCMIVFQYTLASFSYMGYITERCSTDLRHRIQSPRSSRVLALASMPAQCSMRRSKGSSTSSSMPSASILP